MCGQLPYYNVLYHPMILTCGELSARWLEHVSNHCKITYVLFIHWLENVKRNHDSVQLDLCDSVDWLDCDKSNLDWSEHVMMIILQNPCRCPCSMQPVKWHCHRTSLLHRPQGTSDWFVCQPVRERDLHHLDQHPECERVQSASWRSQPVHEMSGWSCVLLDQLALRRGRHL